MIGGSGGAGASVFAAALASAATAAGSVLLVDADPLGAGVDQILGMEGGGVRWDALMHATGRLSARSLRETLPQHDGVAVLTWPAQRTGALEAFAVREVLSAGARGFDYVLLDLPRHPDPVTDEAITRCDRLILVSTLTLPAVSAAGRLAMRLPEAVPRHLVTRGRHSGITPEEVSRLLSTPLLAAMSDQRGLDESINLGAGPVRGRRGPLARAAREAMDGSGREAGRRMMGQVSGLQPDVDRGRSRTTRSRCGSAHSPAGRPGPARTGPAGRVTPPSSRCTTRSSAMCSAPGRSSRCCVPMGSPMCWSTGRSRSGWIAVRASNRPG